MPISAEESRFSKERGVLLLTTQACAQVSGKHGNTILRAMRKPGVYVEYHSVKRANSRGTTRTAFIDPQTLGFDIDPAKLELRPPQEDGGLKKFRPPLQTTSKSSDHHPESSDHHLAVKVDNPGPFSTPINAALIPARLLPAQTIPNLTALNPQQEADAWRLARLFQPLKELARCERAKRLREIAEAEGLTVRRVQQLYQSWCKGRGVQGRIYRGTYALLKHPRADKGRLKIPVDAYELIVSALVSNSVAASAPMIHKTQ